MTTATVAQSAPKSPERLPTEAWALVELWGGGARHNVSVPGV